MAFPGLFRGVLDAGIFQTCDEHKIATVEAIAGMIHHHTAQMSISDLCMGVSTVVADAVKLVGN
ncbi:MAG: hypothetical protein NZL83_00235 [Candidatus Absconditabacterales bacterium]|nr:hypothetical protein [Candidatus Absconditabacterales bacterium]